jgi:hypothetical protein
LRIVDAPQLFEDGPVETAAGLDIGGHPQQSRAEQKKI